MDELALLRDQVATERRHFAAVKEACRAALRAGGDREALADTCRAAIAYLAYGARRLHAQDHAHVLLLRPRIASGDAANHRVLDDLASTLERARAALLALESAPDPVAGVTTYLDFVDEVLGRRRHSLEALFQAHYSIDDWRATSFVDADSILEERERYAAFRA